MNIGENSVSTVTLENENLINTVFIDGCLEGFMGWTEAYAGYMEAEVGSWQEGYFFGLMAYYEIMMATECDS